MHALLLCCCSCCKRFKEKEKKPKTLADLGYKFSEDGKLRSLNNDQPFIYEVKPGNRAYNQKHYDNLGEAITEEVYSLLESQEGLIKINIPLDGGASVSKSFIFASKNWKNAANLLILMHGSGPVRAGQWSRKVIINEGLDCGSQIPYIRRALQENYGVIVLNGNQCSVTDGKNGAFDLMANKMYEDHACYVWKHLIAESKADKIVIVAFSYGGAVLVHLASVYFTDFLKCVCAIAFVDSVHRKEEEVSTDFWNFLAQIGKHWVCSTNDLNAAETSRSGIVPCVAAGTAVHGLAPANCMESIFRYFSAMVNSVA